MNDRYDCEHVTELAAELALGIAVGEERAKALEHLARCASCRRLVNELSALTDDILALAPAKEPPAGFESRVLTRFAERRPVRRRWTWASLAATLGALAAVGAMFVAFDRDREIAAHYRDALKVANGEYFGVRPLTADDGMQEGYLFIYDGRPSWVFVALDDSGDATFRVEAEMQGGKVVHLGWLDDGKRSWGTTLGLEMSELEVVRVVDPAGSETMTAEISH